MLYCRDPYKCFPYLYLNRASDLIKKIKKRKKKDVEDAPIVDPSQTKKFRAGLNEEFKYAAAA